MNILGITTSPKSRQLFASDWAHHRGALVRRNAKVISAALFLCVYAFLAAVGGGVLVPVILGGELVLSMAVIAKDLLPLSLLVLLGAIFLLVQRFSREYYRAAELGYASIFDFDADFSPRARLRSLQARQQAAQEGRNDA
ncbi:hypothetical protein ACUNE3_22530 [Serratia sp. IR-2025]